MGTGLLIPTDVTLSGDAGDVWIFQNAQDPAHVRVPHHRPEKS
jgi:hypothetical protein